VRVISGRVWYRGRLEPLSVGIDEDGKIAAVRKTLRADESIDHGDALILPGAVDLHVHMREPGLTHKEDFASGTRNINLFQLPRTGQINLKFALDPAGTKREQNNSIPKPDGLADVVGDKDDSAAGLGPNAFQLVVQEVACLRVERREGLVHK